MSHQKKQGRRAAVQQRRQRRQRLLLMSGVVLVVAVVVAGAIALTRPNDSSAGRASSQTSSGNAAAWSATPFTGGARLAVDQHEIDHGAVPYGYAVEASYRLKNVGDQPLMLGDPTVNTLEGC
jgi:hypothetical protein